MGQTRSVPVARGSVHQVPDVAAEVHQHVLARTVRLGDGAAERVHFARAERLVPVVVQVHHHAAAGVDERPPYRVRVARVPVRVAAREGFPELASARGDALARRKLGVAEPTPPSRLDDLRDAHARILDDHVVEAAQGEPRVGRDQALAQRALPAAPAAD